MGIAVARSGISFVVSSVCVLVTNDGVTEIIVAGAATGVASCAVIIIRYKSILQVFKSNGFLEGIANIS